MKKFFNSVVLAVVAAMVSAVLFAGCSDSAADMDSSEVAVSSARTVVSSTVVTLTSDLNPGYGKAVYFTGTFEEGKKWTVALRGSYVDGKWTCNVSTYRSTFEYKALVGDWDNGETVTVSFSNLSKLGEASNLPGYQGMPSGTFVYDASNVKYGDAVYFYFTDGTYSYALRGEYFDTLTYGYCPTVTNVWKMPDSCHFYQTAVAYVGSYDLGEKVYPTFQNLTWESGENHVYTK